MPSSLVKIDENTEIYTTSIDVARRFDKRHDNILRDIDKIKRDLSTTRKKDFFRSSFRRMDYVDVNGQIRPMYRLSMDGFSFLVMGYSGKVADSFKIGYINEFNRMKRLIRDNKKTLEHVLKYRLAIDSFKNILELLNKYRNGYISDEELANYEVVNRFGIDLSNMMDIDM